MRFPATLITILLSACVLSICSAAPPEPPPTVTRAAVDKVVADLVAELWKSQTAAGHWETIPKPGTIGEDHNFGGTTALALLGLKVAGVDEKDARFQKGLKWLLEQRGDGTYFRGLRATLLGQLKDEHVRRVLLDDGKTLLGSIRSPSGTFSYVPPADQLKAGPGDFSNTQYGLLGVWAASNIGFEVPVKFWQLLESAYLGAITPDGGWDYLPGGKNAYGSMTVAAIASLFVIWDKLYLANDGTCRQRTNPELIDAINRGVEWMSKNFAAYHTPNRDYDSSYHYYLYGLERIGVASGVKLFGAHDWYRECAAAVLSGKVRPGNTHQQAWTLLFLCYGRAPVAVNKLRFGTGWNERPRDIAGLCRHLVKITEHHHNWQIMPIEANQDELHDAPILAMSGRASFALKPDEVRKIRTFLLRGGTLYAEAVDNSLPFTNSAKALCQAMFPNLEVARLQPDHPIYSSHAMITKAQPDLLGLSDGVRTMVIISKDMGCDWQRSNEVGARVKFDFGDNLVHYASDRGQLWSKEESYWPADQGKKPDQAVTIGRVVHGSLKAEHIWNPSGGTGWQRQDILSRNSGGPAIATVNVDLTQAVDIKQTPILYITGVGKIVLNDEAKQRLKDYVAGGGLLLADAAGGKQEFADSFVALAEGITGGKLAAVTSDALPFIGQLGENGQVWYRHREGLPRVMRGLEMQGIAREVGGTKRWSVLFLPGDLTYAMNGAPALDPSGLDPVTADQFIRALIQWRLASPAAATPASAPASN